MRGSLNGTQTQYLHKTSPPWPEWLHWPTLCTSVWTQTVTISANHPIVMYMSIGQFIVCCICIPGMGATCSQEKQTVGRRWTYLTWVGTGYSSYMCMCTPKAYCCCWVLLHLSHLSNQSANLVSEIQSVGHENQLAWPWRFTKSRGDKHDINPRNTHVE